MVGSTGTTEYDAIVIGAGYPGLISGAILARNGMKTVVIDEIDQVGGRSGSTAYDEYWLDLGHRDARDFGDVALSIGEYGRKAMEAAGAEVSLVGPIEPKMTVHLVPEGKSFAMHSSPEGLMQYAAEVLGLSPDHAKAFMSTLGSLGAEDPEKLRNMTFREWLPTLDEPLRNAFKLQATTMYSIPPEDTSVGRYVQFLKSQTKMHRASDPEVGGMQGFMEPYARVIRKCGGEIKLGLKTLEVLLEDKKIEGIVVRDRSSTVQVLKAPFVVYTHPIWDVFQIVKEELFPQEVVLNARNLERYNGDQGCLNLGISEIPTIKATGQVDRYMGWNRILRGPDRLYGGGWLISTNTSKTQAPAGKHLLTISWGTAGPDCKGYEPFQSFADCKAKLNSALDYLHQYYVDFEKIIEWKTYNLVKAPTTIGFFWKPVPRAPLEVPTIKGLYFAAASTEVDGSFHEIACNAALQATGLILKNFENKAR